MPIDLEILNKTVSLIAKRNSGKSVLLRYLVKQRKNKFDKIFVISPTEEVSHFYKDITDKNCIFYEWKEDWAEQLIKRMTETNSGVPEKKRKQILVILDDIFADMNAANSPALKKIYLRGRHIGIAVIATCQYLYNLPPICRNNTDWVLVGQMNQASKQLLGDEYLFGDIDKKDFIKLYNRSTIDYQFLVINTSSVKDDDLNQIYGVIKTPEGHL